MRVRERLSRSRAAVVLVVPTAPALLYAFMYEYESMRRFICVATAPWFGSRKHGMSIDNCMVPWNTLRGSGAPLTYDFQACVATVQCVCCTLLSSARWSTECIVARRRVVL